MKKETGKYDRGLNALDGMLSRKQEPQAEEAKQEPQAKAQGKQKDVVLSLRLDSDIVEQFNNFAFYKRMSKKKALELIISEYLGGTGLDEADAEILARFMETLRSKKED